MLQSKGPLDLVGVCLLYDPSLLCYVVFFISEDEKIAGEANWSEGKVYGEELQNNKKGILWNKELSQIKNITTILACI